MQLGGEYSFSYFVKAMKALFLLFGCTLSIWLSAQVTFLVDQVPANTPVGDSLYIAGTFNGWDPGSAAHILTGHGNGMYSITLPVSGTVKYKFTRGSWTKVEGDSSGTFRPDREATVTAGDTLHHTILSWEDLGGGGSQSTAAANVHIDSQNFYIPQLNRTRRIWVYLPPDYGATTRDYPVLYMHDGQNVFDAATSFAGEWKVDETLNQLYAQGDSGIIVVAIDNGGVNRIDEYSPWVNPQYGGGEGDEYVDFIVQTLKPYIDQKFRTKSGRKYTGIMGSSMGGLISFYAALEYDDVFSRAGIFSPSLWFSNQTFTFAQNHIKQFPTRLYFLMGGQEGASAIQDMQSMVQLLEGKGYGSGEIIGKVTPGGTHSEGFWASEFGEAYQWLFSSAPLGLQDGTAQPAELSLSPNPTQHFFQIRTGLGGFPGRLKVEVYNAIGNPMVKRQLDSGEQISTDGWQTGLYLVKVEYGEKTFVLKLRVVG